VLRLWSLSEAEPVAYGNVFIGKPLQFPGSSVPRTQILSTFTKGNLPSTEKEGWSVVVPLDVGGFNWILQRVARQLRTNSARNTIQIIVTGLLTYEV
jgi:hypothetical protein